MPLKCPHCGKEFDLGIKVIEKGKADWRKEPATPNQKGLLTELGVQFTPTITKGDADELIKFHLGEAR